MTENSQPLVSFVVPCYNYGRYLSQCLKSIFEQEGKHDFEIVLVDDGSTDNTREVISMFQDPRLRVISHKVNLGHVDTINEGLGAARGAFIARIDPDDCYRPYFLSAVLEKFNAFPEVGLVYGDVALINEHGQITLERCDRIHGGHGYKGNELLRLLKENFICSPTVIARRQAWEKTLPVPKGLAFHDWYFTLMMAREYEFYYIDRILADYRVHPENLHAKLVQNKKEEPSIFWLLDFIFNSCEKNEDLEVQKQRLKRHIYGEQYLALANKYFGFEMKEDARRCYIRAIRNSHRLLFRFDVLRRLMAILIGFKIYNYLKTITKKILRIRPNS